MCADFMPQMPDSKVDQTDGPTDDRSNSLAEPAESAWGRGRLLLLPARWLGRTGLTTLRWLGWGLLGLAVVASLAWAFLLIQILPRVGEWRDELAQQATQALGAPVRVGEVVGRADGIWPVLSLREVQILDDQGRTALRLPEVEARLSLATLAPTALLDRELRLDRLVIVAPELDIRRDRGGVLHVAGLTLPGEASASGGSAAGDWVLSQSRIQIRQGTVRWRDEYLGAPTLALQQVELTLKNRPSWRGRVHELSLSATPPAEFGRRFRVDAHMSQPIWLVGQGDAARLPGGGAMQQAGWVPRLDVETTRPVDWRTWSGEVKARFEHVDVRRLRQHIRLPVEVASGQGAVSASLDLARGRLSRVGLQADVRDIQVRLAPGLPPLAFKRLSGEVTAGNDELTASLAYRDLAFTLADGLSWPASSGRLAWLHQRWPNGWPETGWGDNLGGEVQADRLDLAQLALLADRLPLSARTRAALSELAPRGVIEDLSWRWEGEASDPKRYQFKTRVRGLGLSESQGPGQGRPGLSGADVTVQASETGGSAELTLRDGWLGLPGVFEAPRIELDSLSADVRWTVQPPQDAGGPSRWQVDVRQARFANAEAAGQLAGSWRTGETAASRLPGHLELRGSLSRAQATAVWRYLPLTVGDAARQYVRHAIRGGTGQDVTFEVNGQLDGFPFPNDQGGRFRVKVPVREASLDYAPAAITGDAPGVRWTPFTDMAGELAFEGQRMVIRQAKGRLGGIGQGTFVLTNVEGRIDDLAADDPVLTIGGQGEGPLNDALTFLAASPLSTHLGAVLTKAQGQGQSALRIDLAIPLNRSIDTQLKGEVILKEKDRAGIRLGALAPALTQVRGRIAFTESQLQVQARTKVWGQEMVVDGQRGSDGALKFTAQGQVSADALRQAEEYPFLMRLAPRLSGEAPVSVQVSMAARSGHDAHQPLPEVVVSSQLRGIASGLPAPLNKAANQPWPLKVSYRIEDEAGHHDAIQVDLGNPAQTQMTSAAVPWLRVDLRRDVRGEWARVQRGLMQLSLPAQGPAAAPMPLPAKGVAAQVHTPSLDLKAWQDVLDAMTAPPSSGSPVRPSTAESLAADESLIPETIHVQTAAASWQQRTLRNVSATLQHPAPNVWKVQLDSAQAAGQIDWLPERIPAAASGSHGRVVARLSRLLVPEAEAQALADHASDRLVASESTASLPSLDIVIDQFQWKGLDIGRFEVEAVNRLIPVAGGPGLPEWRVTRMKLANADAELDAVGNWTSLGAQNNVRRPGDGRVRPRSAFSFTLDLRNSGALMARLGLPQAIKGGKGKLTGQVSWLGSPLDLDVPSLSGDLKVALSEGQFLKADAGMARLLGVLSLQALPRRFLLDFRDIFQQGFAFDSVEGDIKVSQGQATTRNLRMRGVQAVVLIEGQADLLRETQDLTVYVVPEINAGTASLAYAAINPVIGLGTFVAQMLLRKQVSEAATTVFRIGGTWADPVVDKGLPPRAEGASPAGNAAK